ncbi:MAG: GNAT family N-acetyltransferase [Cyanobacteria bacterium]|nr:GNAT family N-acetyltransferase [Cyanobacteriota bacterium]
MTIKYTIRSYREADLGRVLTVWEKASAIAHPFLSRDFLEQERHNIPQIYLPRADTWVAEVDGVVVGFMALLDHEVGALFVEPSYHGMGLGTALLNQARKLHGDLEVKVFRDNHLGLGFYLHYGFQWVSQQLHGETGHEIMQLRFTETA